MRPPAPINPGCPLCTLAAEFSQGGGVDSRQRLRKTKCGERSEPPQVSHGGRGQALPGSLRKTTRYAPRADGRNRNFAPLDSDHVTAPHTRGRENRMGGRVSATRGQTLPTEKKKHVAEACARGADLPKDFSAGRYPEEPGGRSASRPQLRPQTPRFPPARAAAKQPRLFPPGVGSPAQSTFYRRPHDSPVRNRVGFSKTRAGRVVKVCRTAGGSKPGATGSPTRKDPRPTGPSPASTSSAPASNSPTAATPCARRATGPSWSPNGSTRPRAAGGTH